MGRVLTALALVVLCPVALFAQNTAVRAYLDAIAAHEAGQRDKALSDVADAPLETIHAIAEGFDAVLVRDFGDLAARNHMRRRAAILHTDLALLLPSKAAMFREDHARRILKLGPAVAPANSVAYSDDGRYVTGGVESGHWPFASWILTGIQPDPAADEFVRRWYRAVAATYLNEYYLGEAAFVLSRARQVLPRDPILLLYAGAMHEALASPRFQNVQGVPDRRPSWRRVKGTTIAEQVGEDYTERAQLRKGERTLQEAVRNGAPAEASLRLARVVGRLGRHEDAVALLEHVTLPQGNLRLAYLRELLLGSEYAALGRTREARTSFARAAGLVPTAQSPWIALAAVARRDGDRPGALDALRQLATLPPTARDRSDPWWDYFRSYASDAAEQMAVVRGWPRNERPR